MFTKLFRQLKQRKFAAIAILLFVVIGGYFGYTKIFGQKNVVRYDTAQVEKGALIVAISGSGQVSSSNQLDIKPKASGEIVGVYVTLGQEVNVGKVLAIIDTQDAERTVRNDETSLETAKLEFDKLLKPIDELTLLQAENSLTQTKESKKKAEDNLKKTYEDGFNSTANAFLELPDIMAGLYDMLFSSNVANTGQWNIDYYADAVKNYDEKSLQYKEDASAAYRKARAAYDKNFADYKATNRSSDQGVIELLIEETYNTTRDMAEAIKSVNNLIQFYKDKLTERGLKPNALANTHLSTLSAYTGKTNSHLSSLLSARRTIEDAKETIVNYGRSIEEKELSLVKTKAGPDELEIRAKKIAIQQKEDALLASQQALTDHYVKALFSGVIVKVSVKKGDSASSGSAIATLAAKQEIAEISLNEVDVAKVKAGQKATFTFDAIPDLTITGQVVEVDAVGTVSQGVVTYAVKIAFDTQDERVKTAMSVSATIVTDAKLNVLLVPNSAIKTDGNTQYVEISEGQADSLRAQTVETGLSNDEFTEIISGLKEGDLVVSRTIQASSQQQQTQQQTGAFRMQGLPGGMR